MPKLATLTGMKFGKLRVLTRAESRAGNTRWNCVCECGKETIAQSGNLKTGKTRSCGCGVAESASRRFKRHGASGSPEYEIWLAMRQRCENQKHVSFPNYGGRGIQVCERWNNFQNFLADMGPRPSAKHSIERERSTGNYEPSNCRWATRTEQNNNSRHNRILRFKGRSMNVTQWARELGLRPCVIFQRLHRKWSIRATLTSPVK